MRVLYNQHVHFVAPLKLGLLLVAAPALEETCCGLLTTGANMPSHEFTNAKLQKLLTFMFLLCNHYCSPEKPASTSPDTSESP